MSDSRLKLYGEILNNVIANNKFDERLEEYRDDACIDFLLSLTPDKGEWIFLELSSCYAEPDDETSYDYLLQSVACDNVEAMYICACAYENNPSNVLFHNVSELSRDEVLQLAKEYYEKAAHAGHVDALYRLGQFHVNQVTRYPDLNLDYMMVIDLWQRAKDLGSVNAAESLEQPPYNLIARLSKRLNDLEAMTIFKGVDWVSTFSNEVKQYLI